jgi:NAD(P)H dehydrogenase (quinone)
MLSLTSSGAPGEWLQAQASWEAIRTLFDSHFASVCGLTVLDHVHFGGIVPNMTASAVESEFDRVRDLVGRLF